MKRGQKKKFDYLNKNGAYSTKKDFIETDYVNGIYSEDGSEVMRALTKEEKDFLMNFYKETVHAKPDINEKTKKLTIRIKSAIKRYKINSKKLGKKDPYVKNVKYYINRLLKEFKKEKEKLGSLYCDFFECREIYSENYKRNICAYNRISNSKGMIEDLENILMMEDLED